MHLRQSSARVVTISTIEGTMNEQDMLDQYFAICQRIYEQMERDGTWPWATDSPNAENLVEWEDKSDPS